MEETTGTRARAPSSDRQRTMASTLLEGMPGEYYERYDAAEIRAHAAVIHGRGNSLVAVEPCPGPPEVDHAQWLCVVTEDRPGLLSLLSAAISAHSLDILSARVYCRSRPGRKDEAVDLFCVRGLKEQAGKPLHALDYRTIQRTIESLLRGEIDVQTLENRAAQTSRPKGAPPVVVYFDDRSPTDLMIVEAGDRPGLLLAISLTIFREKLTIVRSHVTTFAATARDEFELAETDGTRLSAARRTLIADKVREAVAQESVKERRH
ncbi:MAG TPA: hypothetical protein VHE30_15835 [Polyangiaceae bacterium]|nr:hypothetical protein [Polyangiaceae bacterium]